MDAPYGVWSITEDVYAKYKLLFDKGAENGFADKSIAMVLFQQSKQPQDVIDEVYVLYSFFYIQDSFGCSRLR